MIIVLIFLLFSPSFAFAANYSVAGVSLNKSIKPMREIKREHVVPQSLDFSCGAAGLSTLLKYYLDDPVTEKEIIEALLQMVPLEKVKDRRGFSLLDLKNYVKTRGYVVTGYKMSTKFLRGLDRPALVPIKFKNYHHFVIVKGVVADRVFLADPAAGNISMKVNKFEDLWINGIGLVIEKNINDKKPLVFALKVDKNDIKITDYKMMRNLTDVAIFRTTIYPGEF